MNILVVYLLSLLLCSCSAVVNVINYGKAQDRSVITHNVDIYPDTYTKNIYIQYNNFTSLDISQIKKNVVLTLQEHGYTIVDDKSKASFGVILHIRFFGKLNNKEYISIASLYNEGQYENIGITDHGAMIKSISITQKNNTTSLGSILNLEGAYKEIDLGGILTGVGIGLLINPAMPTVMISATIGGMLFQTLNRASDPTNYVAITDITVFKKLNKQVSEYNLKEYSRGISTKSKVEFTDFIDTQTQDTKAITSVRGILLKQTQAETTITNNLQKITLGLTNL